MDKIKIKIFTIKGLFKGTCDDDTVTDVLTSQTDWELVTPEELAELEDWLYHKYHKGFRTYDMWQERVFIVRENNRQDYVRFVADYRQMMLDEKEQERKKQEATEKRKETMKRKKEERERKLLEQLKEKFDDV